MRSSLEWNIIAGRIAKQTLRTDLMRYFHQYAMAFAEQAEKIESMEKEIAELKQQVHILNNQR